MLVTKWPDEKSFRWPPISECVLRPSRAELSVRFGVCDWRGVAPVRRPPGGGGGLTGVPRMARHRQFRENAQIVALKPGRSRYRKPSLLRLSRRYRDPDWIAPQTGTTPETTASHKTLRDASTVAGLVQSRPLHPDCSCPLALCLRTIAATIERNSEERIGLSRGRACALRTPSDCPRLSRSDGPAALQ